MKSLVVAGLMSGTSADGVDVAVCRIGAGPDGEPKVRVLGHRCFPYERRLREAVLKAMDAKAISVAELSRLHWRLGAVYAECVEQTCTSLGVAAAPHPTREVARGARRRPAHEEDAVQAPAKRVLRLGLIGCHGQTVYHQAVAAPYLGANIRVTWQIGEAAVLAERLRVPVVSDFRPADLAAGGQAAPLVPMLDWVMFRSARVGRVLQNLGGIGNLTAIPAGATADGLIAFDTGPGNMVIDHCMRRLFGKEFDRGGAIARRGHILRKVVEREMRAAYFALPPPKSCGREEFGAVFAETFIERCRAAGARDEDVVATATALTAASAMQGYRRFVVDKMAGARVEYAAAGGGARNGTLMRMLQESLGPEVRVRPMEELGVATEAKEAVAFALLAWLTWERRPGNLTSATGAERGVVLGKVSFG